MATGDAAAAAGLPVVPPTKDYRLGYDDINKLADALANHMTNGTHPANKITGQLATSQYKDKSVTRAKIADQAITEQQIYRTPAVSSFGTSGTGWSTGSAGASSFARRNAVGDVALRLVTRRTGGRITASDASGGIADTLCFTITDETVRPLYSWPVAFKYYSEGRGTYEGLATIDPDGKITINSLAPGVDIVAPADGLATLVLAANYPGLGLS